MPDHAANNCLHCAVAGLVEEWFERHGERRGPHVVIDIPLALGKLAEVSMEIAQLAPDRPKRRGAMKFAHDALDAALEARRTGKPVPLLAKAVNDG